MLTLSQLKGERVILPWVPDARIAILALGIGFALWLGLRLVLQTTPAWGRRVTAFSIYTLAPALIGAVWYVVFFVW